MSGRRLIRWSWTILLRHSSTYKISENGDKLCLKINTAKTDVMIISKIKEPPINIRIYNKIIDVQKFKYQGTCINSDPEPNIENIIRVEHPQTTFKNSCYPIPFSALT